MIMARDTILQTREVYRSFKTKHPRLPSGTPNIDQGCNLRAVHLGEFGALVSPKQEQGLTSYTRPWAKVKTRTL